MKRVKTLLAIIFCALSTSILGACSCSGADITVTKISLNTNSIDVVVEEEFSIEYTLQPSKSTNTKVFITVVDGKNVVSVNNNEFIVERSYRETVYFTATKEGTAIIEFKTADKSLTSRCAVTVHEKPAPLTNPEITFNNGRVEWNEVMSSRPNHSIGGYRVNINGSEFDLPNSQLYYDGSGEGQIKLLAGTEYDIKVMALGDKIYDADSEYGNTIKVHVLPTPENVTATNGVLAWDEVVSPLTDIINETPISISYKVQLANGVYENTTGLSFNFANVDMEQYVLGVTAFANDEYKYGILDEETGVTTYVYDSVPSSTTRVKKLTSPQNFDLVSDDKDVQGRVQNSYLKWNAVSSATSYKVVLSDGTKTYTFDDLNTTRFDFANYVDAEFEFESGTYTAYVLANGNPSEHIYGDEFTKSAEITFKKLPYVSATVDTIHDQLVINTAGLSSLNLDSNDIASLAFELYFTNTADQTTFMYRHTGGNVVNLREIAKLEVGTYVCGVRVVANAPVLDDEQNEILLANCDLNMHMLDTTNSFSKINGANTTNITKDGFANFNHVENATHYNVFITNTSGEVASAKLPADSEFITVDGDVATLDLSEITDLSLLEDNTFYKLQIVPLSDTAIDGGDVDCRTFEFNKLSAPKNVTVTNNVVTWDSTTNFGYVVKFNNTTSDVLNNEMYTPTATNVRPSNLVKVVVLGNDINTLNSDETSVTLTKLSTIENVEIQDGVLVWTEYTGSTYVIQYYSGVTLLKESEVSENSISGVANEGVKYTLCVYRKQDGFFNSDTTNMIAVRQLQKVDSVSVVCADNTANISWTAVEYANTYEVKYVDKNGNANYISTTTNSVTLPLTSGFYKVSIIAKTLNSGIEGDPIANPTGGFYILNSASSDEVEFEVLATPVVSVSNGVLNFAIDSKNTAEKFELTFVNVADEDDTYTKTVFATAKSGTYDMDDIPAGVYNVTVKAYALKDSNVIHSEVGVLENVEKLTAPSAYTEGGELKFNSVVGAQSYELYNFNGSDYAKLNASEYTLAQQNGVYTITLNTITSGAIKVKSIAQDGKINSSIGNAFEYERLATPQGLSKNGATLSWQNVTNNLGYSISCDADKWEVAKDVTTFTVPSLTDVKDYEFKIFALGNSVTSGKGYLNSATASYDVVVLTNPSGLNISASVVGWDTYRPSTSLPKDMPLSVLFKVYEYDGTSGQYLCDDTFGLQVSLGKDIVSYSLLDVVDLTEGSYKFSVQYIGNGNDVLSSEEVYYTFAGSKEEVGKLTSPALYVQNGALKFNKIDNADGYYVYLMTGETPNLLSSTDYTLSNSGDTYTLTLRLMSAQNTVSVRAVSEKDGYISSTLSDSITVRKLGVPTLSVSGGQIRWTTVENVQKFILRNTNENKSFDYNNSVLFAEIEALGLSLTEPQYTFTVQALGSADMSSFIMDDEKKVYFLDGDISSSISVNIVEPVTEVYLKDGVVYWQNVDGVLSYKLTITVTGKDDQVEFKRVDSTYSETSSFDLHGEVEIESYTSDSAIEIKIEPFAVYSDQYYIVGTGDNATITITKPSIITDLYVEDGVFSWSVSLSALDIMDVPGLVALYDKHLAGTTTEEDQPLLQKYYRYFMFDLNINGEIIEGIEPTDYELDALNNKLIYRYEILDPVTAPKVFTFSIASCGNTNEGLDGVQGVLPSNYSDTLTATKYPVLVDTTTQNGNIYFQRIPEVDGKYLLTATPASSDYPTLEVVLTPASSGTSGLVIENNSDQAVIYYVYDLFKDGEGNHTIVKNLNYTYQLCLLGTEYANKSTSNILLKSNYYNSVTINFLDQIVSFQYSTARGPMSGGVLAWQAEGDRNQILYLLSAVKYDNISGENWLEHKDIIKIELPCDANYFEFNGVYGQDIPSGDYVTAIFREGDGINYIEGGISNIVRVTKLDSVTNVDGSWLGNGNFVWAHNNQNGIYNYVVKIFKTTGGTKREVTQVPFTLFNTATTYVLPEQYASDGSYSLEITPLGTQYGGINYVAGNAVETNSYWRLADITPYFDTAYGQQIVRWAANSNANNYEVKIGVHIDEDPGLQEQEFEAGRVVEYDISDYISGGEYFIKVKAISLNRDFLTGVYGQHISVTKMFIPQIRVLNGEVVWNRSGVETLMPEQTKVVVTPCNSEGVTNGESITTYKDYDPLDVVNSFKHVLGDIYETGYYKVEVNFETSETGEHRYVVGSDVSELVVFKHPTVNIEFGELDEDGQGECEFENYVKWEAIENCTDYKVRLITLDAEGNDLNNSAGVEYYTIKSHPTMFEQKTIDVNGTEKNYVFLDLAYMMQYGANSIKVYVSALGNTTTYESTNQAYLTSKEVFLKVDNPLTQAPIITSTNEELANGIVKWDSQGVNCMVEILVSGNNAYFTNISGDSISKTTGNSVDTKFTEASAKEVFYLPYTGTNFKIKLRYYNSNFTSDYTVDMTVKNELFFSGSGLENDPYILYATSESEKETMLSNIVKRPSSYIKMYTDVTLTQMWQKSGSTLVDGGDTIFDGILDGNGHKISNISLLATFKHDDNGTYAPVSMFKEIGTDGVVRNITLETNVTVGSSTSAISNAQFGLIAMKNYGLIDNVTVSGTVTFTNCVLVTAGGLVKDNYGTISNITLGTAEKHFVISADIANREVKYLGGVAYNNYENAVVEDVVIDYVEFTVDNENDSTILGGAVGYNLGVVQNAQVTKNAVLQANNIGGVVYDNTTSGKVIASGFVGNIVATTSNSSVNVGGIVGLNNGEITQCYASIKDVSNFTIRAVEGSNVGGLLGLNYASVSNSYVVNLVSQVNNCNYGSMIGYSQVNSFTNNIVYDGNDTINAVGAKLGGVDITGIEELTALEGFTRHQEGVFVNLNLLNDCETEYMFKLAGTYTEGVGGNIDVELDDTYVPFVIAKKANISIETLGI